MNAALIQDGYLPVIIPPILRVEYISLLERAHENNNHFRIYTGKRNRVAKGLFENASNSISSFREK